MSLLFELRVTIYYLHLSITSWVTEINTTQRYIKRISYPKLIIHYFISLT